MTRRASVQFSVPMTFRVIKVLTEHHTYHGWVWLRGYQLDEKGAAVAVREILVQPAGLTLVSPSARAPVSVPRPDRQVAHRR